MNAFLQSQCWPLFWWRGSKCSPAVPLREGMTPNKVFHEPEYFLTSQSRVGATLTLRFSLILLWLFSWSMSQVLTKTVVALIWL